MAAVDTVRGPKPRFARHIYLRQKIMIKLALGLAATVLSTAAFGTFAGRTGDQIMLQEQQNKRVIAEEQKQADMQAMMEDWMKMHKVK
jgi:phosphopantothenoylcysteine synthetase/decarboxylase